MPPASNAYNPWNAVFRQNGRVFTDPHEDVPRIAHLLKERGACTVLDLGCGSGRHVVYLAQQGFAVSYVLGLIFTVVLGATQIFPVLVIASVIPHFFDSGPAAVFGNATGGVRGAILAAIASSIIVTFGISLLIPITGPELANSGTSWCCSDYGTIYMGLGYLLRAIFGA